MTYGQRTVLPPPLRSDVVVALTTVLAMVLLAAPVGLLWARISPRVLLLAQDGGVALADGETKAFIAGDGWFLILTALVGVACGVVAYVLAGQHGAVPAVALAVGGVLAALIAWKVGHRVDLAAMRSFLEDAPNGQTTEAAVNLRARGALVGWALGAVVAYFVLVLLGDRDAGRPQLS